MEFDPLWNVWSMNGIQLVPVHPDLHELHVADTGGNSQSQQDPWDGDLIWNQILIEVDCRGYNEQRDQNEMVQKPGQSPVHRSPLCDPMDVATDHGQDKCREYQRRGSNDHCPGPRWQVSGATAFADKHSFRPSGKKPPRNDAQRNENAQM